MRNEKFNLEKLKKVLEYNSCNDRPREGRWYIVLDINAEVDDFYGSGPMCTAFAQVKYDDDDNYVWYNEDGKELSGYDFRDVKGHNVYTHSVNVTHWIDDHNIGCILFYLLMPEEK